MKYHYHFTRETKIDLQLDGQRFIVDVDEVNVDHPHQSRQVFETLADLLHFWVSHHYPVHIMAGFMVELGMRDKQLQDAINQLDLG